MGQSAARMELGIFATLQQPSSGCDFPVTPFARVILLLVYLLFKCRMSRCDAKTGRELLRLKEVRGARNTAGEMELGLGCRCDYVCDPVKSGVSQEVKDNAFCQQTAEEGKGLLWEVREATRPARRQRRFGEYVATTDIAGL